MRKKAVTQKAQRRVALFLKRREDYVKGKTTKLRLAPPSMEPRKK
jgi:hypothetical protein